MTQLNVTRSLLFTSFLGAFAFAPAQVSVSIYSNFSASGDGTPFSGLVGSFQSPEISFYGNLGGNWHPFGLTSFGAVLTGFLHVPTSGSYTFGLYHDDGTSMTLDGQPFISAGGLGGGIAAAPATNFVAGQYYAYSINFWEDGAGPSGLDLDVLNNGNFNLAPASYLTTPEPSGVATLLIAAGVAGIMRRRRMVALR